jgi:hypothetical protein
MCFCGRHWAFNSSLNECAGASQDVRARRLFTVIVTCEKTSSVSSNNCETSWRNRLTPAQRKDEDGPHSPTLPLVAQGDFNILRTLM